MISAFIFLAVFTFSEKTFCAVIGEKECSKFDYEYRVLERIIFLENKNQEMEQKQTVLERKNEELVEIIKEQRLEMERRDDEIETTLTNTINQTVNGISANRSNVFFTARLPSSRKYNGGETIVFGTVISSEGGAYDAGTGIFTAPRKGVYLFSVTALVDNGYAYVYIRKNSDNIGYMIGDARRSGSGDSHFDTPSVTVVVELAEGDTVYAQSGGGSGYLNKSFTAFSGVLLN